MTWQWPASFLQIYFPKITERGLLSASDSNKALQELDELEYIPGASIVCPLMFEVVAVKVG